MSLTSALETLANYRAHNTRASRSVVEQGSIVLKSNGARKLGDDGDNKSFFGRQLSIDDF